MKNTILMHACVGFTLVVALGCSSSSSNSSGGNGVLTYTQSVQAEVDRMTFAGNTLFLSGTPIADLNLNSAYTSPYGTVTQGVTLNYLTDGDYEFIVYGNTGVFAAECEPSGLDATYGPTHPLCQSVDASGFDTIVVCFANSDGSNLATAQAWSAPQAFDVGHGMICYHDGVKLLSTHIYTQY